MGTSQPGDCLLDARRVCGGESRALPRSVDRGRAVVLALSISRAHRRPASQRRGSGVAKSAEGVSYLSDGETSVALAGTEIYRRLNFGALPGP